MFPGGAITAIVLLGVAGAAVVGVIIYKRQQAKKRALNRF